MTVANPRVRLIVGRHGRALAAGFAVLAVVSLVAAGGVYLDRPTETVTQQARQQTVTTTTASSAEVVAEDSLWPRGTVLEDRPVYLVNATPTMNYTATTVVTGAEDATISHEILVTVRASRDDRAFYTENRTLASETGDGTTVSTTATLDARRLRQRIRDVSDRIGVAGTVTLDLTVRTTYETDPDESYGYAGTETLTTSLGMDRDSYALGEHPSARSTHSEEVAVEVQRPRDWGLLGGLGLLGLLSLLAAGGILLQRPASIDLERARHELHRRQYEQWISPGIIPMGIQQQFIELESLEDVVDVAIDTQERVVYDARRELFAAISENVVYYFSPGGSWMETAFPGMAGRPGGDGSDEPGGGPGGSGGGGFGDLGAGEPGGDGPGDGGPGGAGPGTTRGPGPGASGGGAADGFEDAFDESVFGRDGEDSSVDETGGPDDGDGGHEVGDDEADG